LTEPTPGRTHLIAQRELGTKRIEETDVGMIVHRYKVGHVLVALLSETFEMFLEQPIESEPLGLGQSAHHVGGHKPKAILGTTYS
jgi:hypothetical protein